MLKSGSFEVKDYILFIFISYVFIILSGEALQPPYYCPSDTPCYFVQVQGYYHDKLTYDIATNFCFVLFFFDLKASFRFLKLGQGWLAKTWAATLQ